MKKRLARFLRTIAHVVAVRPIMRMFFGVSVSGREHFGGLNQLILVSNHNSHLDVLLLFCAVPLRLVGGLRPVAAIDYFSASPLMVRLLDWFVSPVWIDRQNRDGRRDPVEVMVKALRAGDSLIVFPEGTRGEPGEMQRFRSGIGRIVEGFPAAALVPAYLSGPERAMPKGASVPLPLWNSVTLGPPLRVSGDPARISGAAESAVRDLEMLETAGRHRRAPRRERKSRTVAVLGIDGSGKSTLSRRIAESESHGAVAAWLSDRLELFENGHPRETQPLITDELRKAIGRSAKRAASLKSYKIPKLAEMLLRNRLLDEVERWFAPRLIVMDGSPLLNLAAWSVLYHGDLDEEDCFKAMEAMTGGDSLDASDPVFRKLPELSTIRRFGFARMRRPDAVILLDLPAAAAMERISGRGGEIQVHETPEKLERLGSAYRLVCKVAAGKMGVSCLPADARNPLEDTARKAGDFVRRSVFDEHD